MTVTANTSRWVARPRLTALLSAHAWARLALVSAPAGFGKSTAVAEWAASPGISAVTVTLERADDDLARFMGKVARALDAAGGENGAEAAFDGREAAATVALLERLRVAASTTPERIALVLDDYHLIEDGRIHRLVAAVVEHLPERCLVVISTRADPPIPLARLRARDELVEVRAEDLRFSADETRALLTSAEVDLDDTSIGHLTDRTEGWAAVLRLAAIALRREEVPAEAVRRFGASHRFVLDYVIEEVLASSPPEVVEFLLRTSILERLCGELCDELTGRADGQAMLEQLERDNVLLQPLDSERRWFRYHALFAEVLRGRLRSECADEVSELHDRASRWFEARRFDDEAIAHALGSGDLARAALLVADASLPRLNAGELATVRHWLDALGHDAVRRLAQLSLSYGWCLALEGDLAAAERRIEDAEAAHLVRSDGGPFSAPMIDAEIALLRSFIAGVRGDSDAAIRAARAALGLVPSGLPAVAEATLRGDAGVFLARAHLVAGDVVRGFDAYVAALPDLRAGRNVLALGRAMNDLVTVCVEGGDPAAGLRLCDEERAQTPAIVRSAPFWAAVAKGREALGDRNVALEAAQQALDLARRAGEGRIADWAADALRRLSAGPADPRLAGGANARLVEPLTEREREVLRLVAQGRSNGAIAADLFVTVGTVKSHVHSISGKLGAANRVEAVARARDLGLLD